MNYEYHTLKNWEAEDIENMLAFDVIPNLGEEYEEVLGNIVKAVDAYVDMAVCKGIDPEALYRKLKDIYILKSQDEKVSFSCKLERRSLKKIGRRGNFLLYIYSREHTSYIIEWPEDYFYCGCKSLENATHTDTLTLIVSYFILQETPFGKMVEAYIESDFAFRMSVGLLEIKNEDVLEYKLSVTNNELEYA